MKKEKNFEKEAVAGEKPKSNARKIANIVINVILVIALVLAAVCTFVSYVSTSGSGVPSILGVRVFSVQTDSMYPTLSPGDLIFDTAVDPADLKVGDIITYWTVISGERVLNTHTIHEIYDGGNTLIFATKGDNNDYEDPLTVHESEIVGKYTGHRITGMGKVFDYLQTSTGFLIVVVIPVALFFLFHLVQFFRVLFEYQNVKNKLLYEQERGKLEDVSDSSAEDKKAERERLEAELREKLKAEILAANAPEEKADSEPEKTAEELEAENRAKLEEELRAKLKAEMEEKARAEEAAKKAAEEREKLEKELRAKIMAEMEAEAKATDGASEDSEN